MADVAARREARKRKILENSENRLKQITGKTESRASINFAECEREVDGLANDTKTPTSYYVNQESDNMSHLSCPSMQSIDSFSQDYLESTEEISHPGVGLHSDKPVSLSHHKPLYQAGPSLYISMAVLLRLFLEFNSVGICPHNMIVAFLMIKCGSVILYGIQPAETSPLIEGLFILSGVSSQKIRFIILGFSALSGVIEHFSLFTFSFVLSDTFITCIKSVH